MVLVSIYGMNFFLVGFPLISFGRIGCVSFSDLLAILILEPKYGKLFKLSVVAGD